ncbi:MULTISPECIES: BrnT family toxin [unclassified Devosia]|uniref:BrnT family toxin n=1 Tax=unclassified Devosia TaxID=196773 RepID=UPI0015FC8354|nr:MULTISPECIES: BrnT family toxin [unclassified Devosia]MBJ6988870.1 BrnT family toxin [Devosia sp. MC521]MBK1794888.1 BrnT family toxin [Devosia sp. WQ 349K1]QMW62221.1 BrnT family toxin [Devosia sp. MC521]
MEFEWDERKRLANLAKHGVDFRRVSMVFLLLHIAERDERADYQEQRWRAVGRLGSEYFVVVYTLRGEVIRIISAWKGGRRDQARYQTIYD